MAQKKKKINMIKTISITSISICTILLTLLILTSISPLTKKDPVIKTSVSIDKNINEIINKDSIVPQKKLRAEKY